MNKKNIFYIKDSKLMLATRDIARHIFRNALKKSATCISFDNSSFTSRSFLDEMYVLCTKNNLQIIDMSEELKPLYNIIIKSHKQNKVYAPMLKIQKLEKTFA